MNKNSLYGTDAKRVGDQQEQQCPSDPCRGQWAVLLGGGVCPVVGAGVHRVRVSPGVPGLKSQGWIEMDARLAAERLLGRIDWQTEVSGICGCPGEALHTNANGKKNWRVSINGAPTILCFHASCIGAVTEANRRLRRELGASTWELRLPAATVQRIERVVGREPVTEERVLRLIADRYAAMNLFYLPPHVAAEVCRRPADFVRAAKRYCEPELNL